MSTDNTVSSIINAVISRLEYRIFPSVYRSLRDDINRMVAPQLKNIGTISPLEENRIIEAIVRRYKDASIQEYEPVGVNAALTTGENQTQSSLQSHHHAGLRRGAAGFDRIEEITNMKNKSNIVKIITTPHLIRGADRTERIPRNKTEINEISNLLIKVLLDDIVSDYTIESTDGRFPEWYSVYASIKAIPITTFKKKWLRIYMNPEIMYRHRISLPAIAMVVSENIGQGSTVLYPPSQIGLYLDIHMNTVSDADYYLKLSNILSLQVGGIASVESSVPIPENLLTNLRIEEVNSNACGDGRSSVYNLVSSAPAFIPGFAWERMIKAMVPDAEMIEGYERRFCSSYSLDELREMILRVPLIYADVIDTREEVDMNDRYRNEIISIGDPDQEYILSMDRAIRITFQQELVNRYPYLEHADLSTRYFSSDEEANQFLLEVMVEYHFFWYIEAICEQVQDLYVLPEVDSTRTYTTSALDCRDNLGYMAMRNMIYREFRENISIHPIHIEVIINNMTLYKEPVSIRRQAVKNDKNEWMSYTTFEDILKYITHAAFAGEIDHMQSVSSQVLTGKMIDIGRGGDHLPRVTRTNPTGNKFVELKLQSQSNRGSSRGRRRAR